VPAQELFPQVPLSRDGSGDEPSRVSREVPDVEHYSSRREGTDVAGLVRQNPLGRSAAQPRAVEKPSNITDARGPARVGRPAQPAAAVPRRSGHDEARYIQPPISGSRVSARAVAVPGDVSRPPTHEEAQLLDLLRQGLKDRAIARALGIGERTVQRRLSRLMATLGAKTRFQAAINAVRRGWV
jgi:DNA-binding CsgD family transcriptional regulator